MMTAVRAKLFTVRGSLKWQEVGHGMLIGAALGLLGMGGAWVLMQALEWMVDWALTFST